MLNIVMALLACMPDSVVLGDDSSSVDSSCVPVAEVCDGVDDDCDGLVDDQDADVSAPAWHPDGDADGYGDPASSFLACTQPSGTLGDATDCDDADAAINPAATETCNDLDDDCDGLVDGQDDSLSGGHGYYADADGDGLGDAGAQVTSCGPPPGHVSDSSDCDDTDPENAACLPASACSLTLARTVSTSGASQVAVDVSNRQIIVPAYDAGSFAEVFDADTFAYAGRFDVGSLPGAAMVDTFGDQVWVAGQGDSTLTVVDRGTFDWVDTIPEMGNPLSIQQDPDSGTVFVAEHDAGHVVAFDPTSLAMLVSSRSLGVLRQVSVGEGQAFAISEAGDVYRLDAATMDVLDHTTVASTPYGSAYVSATDRLFVAGYSGSAVYVLEASTLTLLYTVPLSNPVQMRASEDGTVVAVANHGDNSLALLDASTGTVLSQAATCAGTMDVAEDPATRSWVVTCFSANELAIMGCE